MFLISMAVIVLLLCWAFFPGFFCDFDPNAQDLGKIMYPPSDSHILGCDWLGRDLFSRLVHASAYSLSIGILSSLICILLPLLISSILFFSSSLTDHCYLFLLDIFLAFPPLLFAILIAASTDGGFYSMLFALVLSGWAGNGRILRSYLLTIKSLEFVQAAVAIGADNKRIFWRHILPNLYSPLIVLFSIKTGTFILAESTLSFLGLGSGDLLSWGAMVNGGRMYLSSVFMISFAPALAIAASVFAFQTAGECLEKISMGVRYGSR